VHVGETVVVGKHAGMFFRIEPDDIHLTVLKHHRHLHLSMLLRVVRGVVGFVEDVEVDLLGRPAEEERKRPVGRDARLLGLKEDIGFQVIGLVEPGRELALGPRGHLGVDEEAGFAFELLGGDDLSGLPSGERRFPVPDRDLTNTGASYPAIPGAVVSASGFLSPAAGSFVELAEQGTITITNSSGQQVGSPDSFTMIAALGYNSSLQFSSFVSGTGQMALNAPKSQGDFSLTGTDLFGLINIKSGMGFSVDASLTLVSDPGSLIQLSSLSDVSVPLPNIGAFAGSAVPEPSSFVELGTGLLMLVGAWGWRRDRTRIRQHLFQIPRHGAACIPFVSGLCACLFLLATIPAPVPAGTITVDDIDQPISISSTGFSTTSISYSLVLQQAKSQGSYVSQDDPLQPGPGQSVTYDEVFQEPSPNGSGLIDSASTEVTITGLSNPTPTPTPNISVSVFFEAIVTGPITPGPGGLLPHRAGRPL
jgi:hypothetical protein